MNPLPVVWAAFRRSRFTALLFLALVALATALGVAVSAQERAMRQGSARAADKFDLIVTAPGGQVDRLLSTVYLDVKAAGLMSPEATARALAETRVEFAAPIGFGDNWRGAPVVGTIAPFVEHLSGGLAEGRHFAALEEAVVGALVPVKLGETLAIDHGDADHAHRDGHDHDHDHEEEAEGDHGALTAVGRMKPTGTPWDRAVVVPIEFTWAIHGLGVGHAAGEAAPIGPPFDAEHVPGLPAVVMKPKSVAAAYGLRGEWRTSETAAFFPAEALVEVYALMGDAAKIMGALTLTAQALVVAAILAGLLAAIDLQKRRFATLRALGAPGGYVFGAVWLYVGGLLGAGALLGLPLGWLAARFVSGRVAAETGVAMAARIGATEIQAVAAALLAGLVLALIPALLIYRRPAVEALR